MQTYQQIISQNILDLNEQDLIESIKYYDSVYRTGDAEIEDFEFDNLVDILHRVNPNSDFFNSSIIEDDENSSRKEKHKILMYSLDKYKTIRELVDWINNNCNNHNELLILSPKEDGISLANEELNQHVLTRGKGLLGQISDAHYKATPNYKQNQNNDFHTFGEAIISKQNWKDYFVGKINPRNGKLYKSSRNTVAGLFNNDQPVEELKYVDYIRYGLIDLNNPNQDKIKQFERLNQLNNVKIPFKSISIGNFINKFNENSLENYLNDLYKDWSIDYQIDGLVIEFNDYNLRESLGRERNNNPKFARAIKLPNWFEIYQTRINDINLKVSKQGKAKPVFWIDPVTINGATINKATAYNCKYLLNNNIAIGSTIEIVRSGDVIPKHIKTLTYIDENLNDLKNKLKFCPSCGEPLIWDETNTELVCNNTLYCKDIRLAKLIHFITTLKIEEFGEKEIENLFNVGYDSYSKLLNITHQDLIQINGWANASANKLLKQFKALNEKNIDFALLLHSLDLMDGKVGSRICQLILDNYDINIIIENLYDNEKLLEIIDELIKIKGISNITAEIFINGIYNFFDLKYSELPIKFSLAKTEKIITGDLCDGFKVCFTGIRDENLETKIAENKGTVVSGVSSNTTHLIVKNYSDKIMASSKVQKAQDFGTTIISIDDFKQIFK